MSDCKITPAADGPLLVSGLADLRNTRGSLEVGPKIALCRCGGSARKPYCDGAHTARGFSSAKEEERTPDRRDDYVGREITVHDNRGACAHAGICTERLPAVWRMGEEPWIDPDGAPAAEVAAVVGACPSGALRHSIGGREAQEPEREPAILVTPNGPYAVSGGPDLVGETFAEGASTGRYTLCRCGGSKNKPFCDGAHWSLEFQDDAN